MASGSMKPVGGTFDDRVAAAGRLRIDRIEDLPNMSAYLRQLADAVAVNVAAQVKTADERLRVGPAQTTASALGSWVMEPVGAASPGAAGLAGRAARVTEVMAANIKAVADGLKAAAAGVDRVATICKTAADSEKLTPAAVNQLLTGRPAADGSDAPPRTVLPRGSKV